MRRRVRTGALAATALLVTVAALGCSGDRGSGPGDDKPEDVRSGGPGASRSPEAGPAAEAGRSPALPDSLTGQRLSWKRCEAPASGGPAPGGPWQCATLKVPLDHDRPDGTTIGLALIRSKAKDQDRRIGSLLFNFGGPGGSGVSMLPAFSDGYQLLQERYDLVSFDPRGVAGSDGVRCRTDHEIQRSESVDITPDTPAEEKAYFKDAAAFSRGCARDSGRLLPHLSTAAAARDMDLMRQVLGDDKLHYFGVSYGTELGGVYAHLFPDKVGRLVLDAVVDPGADQIGHAKNQTKGFQRALDNYLKSTGKSPRAGTAEIVDLLRRLDAEPLPTSTDRRLTQSLALIGLILPLYSEQSWPGLTRALEQADKGDGTALLELADSYNDRDGAGRYGTSSHSQRAISCADAAQRTTSAQAKALLPEFRELSPAFGEFLGWDTAGWCHDWPVPGSYETPEVSAKGADPVLVVGTTGDPATPYEGARRMADELGKGVGVHLTYRGEGHGAYGTGSTCVDTTVDAYLLDGKVPEDGKVCS